MLMLLVLGPLFTRSKDLKHCHEPLQGMLQQGGSVKSITIPVVPKDILLNEEEVLCIKIVIRALF